MEQKIVLKNAKFVSHTFADGSQQYVGIVRGDSFVNTDIPTEAVNPREFMGDKNPNFKEMVKTLKTEPEMFSRKNSAGITVFASSLESNGDGSYTLVLRKGDGIANGGHTYNALRSFGTTKASVKFVVEVGVDREGIVAITQALNSHKKVEAWSANDLEGGYEWYQKSLKEKKDEVIYHEGDSGYINITEAVAYLNLFKREEETNAFDTLANMKRSEEGAGHLLNTIVKDTDTGRHFRSSLKWIAKDVHELVIDFTFNDNILTLLKNHKKATGQNWVRARYGNKGVAKHMVILLVGGLAYVGSSLNKNGIVQWKEGFRTHEQRYNFLFKLFEQVINYTRFASGTPNQIARTTEAREAVLRAATVLAKENN